MLFATGRAGEVIYLCISSVGVADAPVLAKRLVAERLAACVNILPAVQSVYRWQGKICEDEESLLFIKTSPSTLGGFEKRFRELHPYECPELLFIPIEEGLKDYLSWVEEVTRPERSPASGSPSPKSKPSTEREGS